MMEKDPSTYNTWSEDDKAAFKTWLHTLLEEKEVKLTFLKKDGTMREMRCSTNANLIPPAPVEISSKSAQKRLRSIEACSVYDLDIQDWRSFRYDSIKTINT